ncbi:NHS-like protein 3 [Palaemon carinicauda]|uniref:NHS-like protein 3 n=1 Tax=Palaemon carinicauda TaxID=392227 RepID=UPI0035B64E62
MPAKPLAEVASPRGRSLDLRDDSFRVSYPVHALSPSTDSSADSIELLCEGIRTGVCPQGRSPVHVGEGLSPGGPRRVPRLLQSTLSCEKVSGDWRPVIDLSALNSIPGIHENIRPSIILGSQSRHPSSKILGRLTDSGRLRNGPSPPSRRASKVLPGSWDRGKPREVSTAPLSRTGIPRNAIKHPKAQSVSIRRKDPETEGDSTGLPQLGRAPGTVLASPSRSPLFPDPTGPQQSPQDEIPPVATKIPVEPTLRFQGSPSPHRARGTVRPQVVAGGAEPLQRGQSSRLPPGIGAFNGCIKRRVGAHVLHHYISGQWSESKSSTMESRRMVPESYAFPHGDPKEAPSTAQPPQTTTCQHLPQSRSFASTSRLETIQRLLTQKGKEWLDTSGGPQRQSTRRSGQFSVVGIMEGVGPISPLDASVPTIAEFLVYLREEMLHSVLAVKGYHSALSLAFRLKGVNISSSEPSLLLRSYELTCPQAELRPPPWNMFRVFRSLKGFLYEPLRQASNRHLTWKTFLLALASSKKVSELHGLSADVSHSRRWGEVILNTSLSL